MATKAAPVGSGAWIAAEKENALQLLQNEKEEVAFPAQHQLEWLNEHMAGIFSKSQIDVANVFKTPGKLRGKTPRTARKRDVREVRIPLSDVFSSSKPLPRESPRKALASPKPHFTIAADPVETRETAYKSQTDSGYHGSSQDTMEIDTKIYSSPAHAAPQTLAQEPDALIDHEIEDAGHDEHRTTEGSFHSAKEDQTAKVASTEAPPADATQHGPIAQEQQQEQLQQHPEPDFDEIGSPSDESTPDRPLIRKSSLTFASLPAREPMKTSIGARISRTSHVDPRLPSANAYAQRPTISTAQPAQKPADDDTENDVEMRDCDDDDEDEDDDDENIQILGYDDSEMDAQAAQIYSKSSTQRLHEKIDMLGKAPPPRTSKSIPSTAVLPSLKQSGPSKQVQQSPRPATPSHNVDDDDDDEAGEDDDDDWIKPLTSPDAGVPPATTNAAPDNGVESDDDEFDCRAPELIAHEERMDRMRTPGQTSPGLRVLRPGFGHIKSASTATLASPAKAQMAPPASPAKSISVSNPALPSTTPQGSPKRFDLSASKSRLQSIMKTAKGLFTSSASISAAAKLETLSPGALRVATNAMPGMYPSLQGMLEDKPLPASPPKEVRKTRSSTEREKEEKRKEKEAKLMQRMDDQLEKARETERQKVAEQKQKALGARNVEQQPMRSPRRQVEDQRLPEAEAVPPSKSARPIRPMREPNKAKPPPTSIRVGTLSRMPINAASASSNAPETFAAEPKRPGLTKKASTASLQSTNSNVLKTSTTAPAPKPRALLAAERKKEQDEREAQRKLDQKRDIERKRAAQQEEARKQEQKQRAEAERKERERIAQEQARRQAQQQAIERKRQEAARKAEQQRLEREQPPRPASRLGGQTVSRPLINHPLPTNPAKPAKRPMEEEAGSVRTQNTKYGAAQPQGDSKRRRTEDEAVVETAPRPALSGAPIRQSQLGKKPSIFGHSSYAPAPPSGLSQFPQPPSRAAPPQMQQYGQGAKIPFAEAPNPAPHTKTPVSMVQQKTIQTVKSSPQYPNGDAINLPEIPTDSEDEDSDDDRNGFPIPDWATPGHLTEQLIRQEAMDGDAVFGPIAPLKMEEIFAKGNKDRLKKLRDRTSSANWVMSGDGLTLEEVKAYREQRERMRVQGGWTYGNH